MENELEAIKQRLLSAEAKISVLEDYAGALRVALFQTVQHLHEQKVLSIGDVAARLQSFGAFSLAAHDQPPPQLLGTLAQILQSLADEYAKHGR